MAYSHNLTKKGIKRKDARMCRKGSEDPAVNGASGMIAANQAIESLRIQG